MTFFRSDPTVDVVQQSGDDEAVVAAARVSVVGSAAATEDIEAYGLIHYLMSHRHGTPFEHGSMTFRVEAPIFVFREWMRHRIGWSYNEESGRYKQLDPVFHIPAPSRPLVNVGTAARPRMVPGTPEQYTRLVERMESSYGVTYHDYEESLADGVAKEVAREVLPVGIYSSMYATANPRSIMAFLSLRVHDPEALFVSYPQYEIDQAAQLIEHHFEAAFPLTYSAFCNNGRVAP